MVASRREIVLVTFGAVEELIANRKLQINQRFVALGTVEASRVPVTIVVLQVLLNRTTDAKT